MNKNFIFAGLMAFLLAGCAIAPPVKSAAELAAQKEQEKMMLSNIQYRSQDVLEKDIGDIIKNEIIKNSFETTQEFSLRKNNEFKKYDHNGYILSFKISNPKNSKESLAYFDPDQSKIFISMPKRQQSIVFLGQKRDMLGLNFSYLNIKTLSKEYDSYLAKNGFGQEKLIAKLREEGIGVAILNSVGGYSEKPQKFFIGADRNVAQDILMNGRLEINVFVDTQYVDFGKKTILIDAGEPRLEPTMNYPYDIERKFRAIPVRLSALRLYDGSEKKIGEWVPSQIFTSSLSRMD
jgi:hypothetical protein